MLPVQRREKASQRLADGRQLSHVSREHGDSLLEQEGLQTANLGDEGIKLDEEENDFTQIYVVHVVRCVCML